MDLLNIISQPLCVKSVEKKFQAAQVFAITLRKKNKLLV